MSRKTGEGRVMQESHTKKSTRIIMWVIAIVMAGGFIGSYFLLIMNNGSSNQAQTQAQTNQAKTSQVDPTAYKVTGRVAQLQITDEVVGTGPTAGAGDLLRIHYKGTIAQTGVKFDSSYDRGEPLTCKLANLVAGWQQGIPGMKVGGKRRLVVPAALGYGSQANATIPADSDLVFEVELLAVNPAGATDQCAQ
jgi:peptidylprolyl isomerase